MCFDNDFDGDWSADVIETSEEVLTTPARCCECHREIAIGETASVVFFQEHELCQICDDDESDRFDDEADKATCAHDFGESDLLHTCGQCRQMLQAVEEIEEREGCPPRSRRPCYGMLWESLDEHYEAGKYVEHAIVKFPQLINHPKLVRLQQRQLVARRV